MAQEKKYLGESGLQKLIEIIKTRYAKLVHSHTISDITDYKVDSEILSNSKNPVQNMVLKSSLDEKVPVTRTVNGKALDADINLSAADVGAANSTHTHDDRYYTETDIDLKLESKSDVTHNHDSNYETKENAQLKYDELKNIQPDWNQNDKTASDYIKNKPFYYNEDGDNWVEDEFSLNSDNIFDFFDESPDYPGIYTWETDRYPDFLTIGNKCKIVWDNVEYICVSYEYKEYISNKYNGGGIGNKSLIDATAENTGEPFFICIDEYRAAWEYYPEIVIYTNETSKSHTIYIYVNNPLKQLDEKYIPDTIARISDIPETVQSDWNQNDSTKEDYIKNKPFFSSGYTTEIITNERESDDEYYWEAKDVSVTTTPITNQNYSLGVLGDYDSGICYGFIAGERYNVIFDGISYDCTAIEPHDNNIDSAAIGNKSIIDSTAENTGEPFYIYKYFERPEYYQSYRLHTKDTEEIIHIISLYHIVDNVKHLEEKYIPDTIARKSYVDDKFDLKADSEHTHNYAASTSVGGTATSCCGFKIERVKTMPENPDANTIYLVIES